MKKETETITEKINIVWDWQLVVAGLAIYLVISEGAIAAIGSILVIVGSYRLLKYRIIKNTLVSVLLAIPLAILFSMPIVLLNVFVFA